MQVDLCVFLAGNMLEEYTPLFLETLFLNCNTKDLHIHVVEKGSFPFFTCEAGGEPDLETYQPVSEKVHNYLLRKQAEAPIPITIYQKHDPTEFFHVSSPGRSYYFQGDDHANTLNWAMENCGSNKWMIFCHSDMIFVLDIISTLMKEMDDSTGMYGIYNHCFAINREAFKKVGVKFNSLTNIKAVPVSHNGYDYVLRQGGDPRCTEDSKVIYGWDVGELLELMMICNGWRCYMTQFENNELTHMVDHLGSGHEYTTSEQMKSDHLMARQNWMSTYKIGSI